MSYNGKGNGQARHGPSTLAHRRDSQERRTATADGTMVSTHSTGNGQSQGVCDSHHGDRQVENAVAVRQAGQTAVGHGTHAYRMGKPASSTRRAWRL